MKDYTSRYLKSVCLFYMGFPILYIPVCAVFFDLDDRYLVERDLEVRHYEVDVQLR